jgi:hypothetical protein
LKGSHGNGGRGNSSRGGFITGGPFVVSTGPRTHCHSLQTAACSPNWVTHTPDCLAQWGVHPAGHDGASNQSLPSYFLSGKTVQQGLGGLGGLLMETCACAGELVKLVPVRINSSGAARTGAKFIASSFSLRLQLHSITSRSRVQTHAIRSGSWKAICFGRGSRPAASARRGLRSRQRSLPSGLTAPRWRYQRGLFPTSRCAKSA